MVMAVGGVLRAALRAGNWARAAAQSRRQARALAQLSEGFSAPRGRMGPEGAVDYLSARGVDPAFPAQFAPMAGGRMFRGPFGRDTFLSDAGGRLSQARGQYSPIVAPYEGFGTMTSPAQRAGMLDDLTAAGLPEDPMLYDPNYFYGPRQVFSRFPWDQNIPRGIVGRDYPEVPF